MAHKKLETGKVVVDWETGDDEGDRKYLFQAYKDFVSELIEMSNSPESKDYQFELQNLLEKWKISIDNQVDDFPRIWISRPQ